MGPKLSSNALVYLQTQSTDLSNLYRLMTFKNQLCQF